MFYKVFSAVLGAFFGVAVVFLLILIMVAIAGGLSMFTGDVYVS